MNNKFRQLIFFIMILVIAVPFSAFANQTYSPELATAVSFTISAYQRFSRSVGSLGQQPRQCTRGEHG